MKQITRAELDKLVSDSGGNPPAVALLRYRRMEYVGGEWVDSGVLRGDEVLVVDPKKK